MLAKTLGYFLIVVHSKNNVRPTSVGHHSSGFIQFLGHGQNISCLRYLLLQFQLKFADRLSFKCYCAAPYRCFVKAF